MDNNAQLIYAKVPILPGDTLKHLFVCIVDFNFNIEMVEI